MLAKAVNADRFLYFVSDLWFSPAWYNGNCSLAENDVHVCRVWPKCAAIHTCPVWSRPPVGWLLMNGFAARWNTNDGYFDLWLRGPARLHCH